MNITIEQAQMFITFVVLIFQGLNAWQHSQTRIAIAELKVYIHENFITKGEGHHVI